MNIIPCQLVGWIAVSSVIWSAAVFVSAQEIVGTATVVRESDVVVGERWLWDAARSRLVWLAPLEKDPTKAVPQSMLVDADGKFRPDNSVAENETVSARNVLGLLSSGKWIACEDTEYMVRVFDERLRVVGKLSIPTACRATRINDITFNDAKSTAVILCEHPARILAINVSDPTSPKLFQTLLTDRRATNDQETVMRFVSPQIGVGAARCDFFIWQTPPSAPFRLLVHEDGRITGSGGGQGPLNQMTFHGVLSTAPTAVALNDTESRCAVVTTKGMIGCYSFDLKNGLINVHSSLSAITTVRNLPAGFVSAAFDHKNRLWLADFNGRAIDIYDVGGPTIFRTHHFTLPDAANDGAAKRPSVFHVRPLGGNRALVVSRDFKAMVVDLVAN